MRFDTNKRYVFDKSTYFKNVLTSLYENDALNEYWIEKCNQKEVNIIDEDTGFIKVNSAAYCIIPKWCIEKPAIKKMVINEEEF